MEIKINREIRDYKETVLFGLTPRQAFCSALGIGAAVVSYVLFRPALGAEGVSWVCILSALPFAALGFCRFHGMTAGQAALAFLRSRFLNPRNLPFRTEPDAGDGAEKRKEERK